MLIYAKGDNGRDWVVNVRFPDGTLLFPDGPSESAPDTEDYIVRQVLERVARASGMTEDDTA